jgi:hypothetical protein
MLLHRILPKNKGVGNKFWNYLHKLSGVRMWEEIKILPSVYLEDESRSLHSAHPLALDSSKQYSATCTHVLLRSGLVTGPPNGERWEEQQAVTEPCRTDST